MNELDALRIAGRMESMGIVVRSAELKDAADAHVQFRERGGNRAMRRAAKRARRQRGR